MSKLQSNLFLFVIISCCFVFNVEANDNSQTDRQVVVDTEKCPILLGNQISGMFAGDQILSRKALYINGNHVGCVGANWDPATETNTEITDKAGNYVNTPYNGEVNSNGSHIRLTDDGGILSDEDVKKPEEVAEQKPEEKTEKTNEDKEKTAEVEKEAETENKGGIASGEDSVSTEDIKDLEAAIKQCATAKKKAEQCCGPAGLGCLVGAEPGSGTETMASIGGILAQSLIAARQLEGMQQNCDSQDGLANFGAGLNGAMAIRCQFSRNTCDNTCGTLKEEVNNRKLACTTTNCKRELDKLIAQLNSGLNTCSRLAQNQAAMITQAGVTVVSTQQMAKLCKDVVAASPPPVAPGIPGNDLCNDPSDLSNPYCRQQFCSQPGTANAPECQNANSVQAKVGGGSGPSNFSNNSFGSKSSKADLSGPGLEDGQPQLPGTKPIEIGERKASQTQAGAGGGLPGAPGGGGGGDSGYDTSSARSKGLNTNVLNGLASGNGYSVSASSFQGGGGYSNPVGRAGGNDKKEPFDLKKFLPKQAPPQRKLAGLTGPQNTLAGQLAAKHDNIFVRVSNKYREMCIMNRLMCPTQRGK